MYESWFDLKEKPFSLTPDPEFLFLSGSHQEALDHLLYGLESGEGFIVVTGDIGVGKTTVCRTLLSRLPDRFATSLIVNPLLTEKELIRAVLEDFGGETPPGTKKDLLDALNRFLLAEAEKGRRPVLIVDEAQNLPPTLLEQVRLLSNLETEKRKLLQIVLIGQNELKEKLALSSLRQLNQRVTVRAEIRPLPRKETARYIDHRLGVAGGGGRALLTRGAEGAIHRRAGGVPRIINMLCDRAFLSAYVRGSSKVERKDVRRASESLDVPGSAATRMLRWVPWVAAPLALLCGLLAAHGRIF
ncbi:MAG: ATPase [Deltaproteobacteria bacterium]|nr:ATPase [Deltaproteobacteria bacterium]PWB64698.1 MAG: ATPase [Deltaproteobacteria bacterium]